MGMQLYTVQSMRCWYADILYVIGMNIIINKTNPIVSLVQHTIIYTKQLYTAAETCFKVYQYCLTMQTNIIIIILISHARSGQRLLSLTSQTHPLQARGRVWRNTYIQFVHTLYGLPNDVRKCHITFLKLLG